MKCIDTYRVENTNPTLYAFVLEVVPMQVRNGWIVSVEMWDDLPDAFVVGEEYKFRSIREDEK